MSEKDHIPEFDFSQITEYIFLGTNLCCGRKSHYTILQEIGITADIDLEHERQDLAPKVNIYLWLPVIDKQAPTLEQIQTGVSLLDRMTKAQKKTYVHCRYGHGRSPTLVAAYFISRGMSVEDAINEIKKSRPEIHLEESQRKILEQYHATQYPNS